MVTALVFAVLLVGSTGWFGEFGVFLSFGFGVGAFVAASVVEAREWRRRRASRGPVPWAPPQPIDHQRHMRLGILGGGTVGLALAVADLLLS